MSANNEIEKSTDKKVTAVKNNLTVLFKKPLGIPPYQRRYCWGEEQVADLLSDIEGLIEKDSIPLFLGTVILDGGDSTRNIVDGQQRLLTLTLLIEALHEYNKDIDVYQILGASPSSLLKATFTDSSAQQQLATNYHYIKEQLKNWNWAKDKEKLKTLFTKLEFVVITIYSQDQAFTFFDSQNSAGKRLSDFDLLKARHLRGIVSNSEVGVGCSRIWEQFENQKVGSCYNHRVAYYLTESLLGRARQRQRNKSVDTLKLKDEYPVLTECSNDKKNNNKKDEYAIQLSPLVKSALLSPKWRAEYNAAEKENFPFTLSTQIQLNDGHQWPYTINQPENLSLQVNQPLVGGEQFFFYIAKYVALYERLFPEDIVAEGKDKNKPISIYGDLLQLHRKEEYRQGAGYPRLIQAWQALLICYVDRFDEDENFPEFVTVSDQYIFSLRITLVSLRRASIESHLMDNEVFSQFFQLATSKQVLFFIKSLLKVQANSVDVGKINKNTTGVRRDYIDRFYWNDGNSEKEVPKAIYCLKGGEKGTLFSEKLRDIRLEKETPNG